MKIWLNKISLLCLLAVALFSCDKDEDRIIVQDGSAPVLTTSGTTVELTEENAASNAVTFNWTASDFGFDAAVKYTLELDMAGNNFANAVKADLGSGTTKEYTVAQLNGLVNQLDIRAFEPNEIDARVVASVSDNVASAISNTVTLTVTPYLTEPPYATLYMVGAATDAGWDNTKAIAMLRDPNDLFVFTYTGKFKADGFKFLGERGKWAPMFGMGDNGTLVFRETESDTDPASFTIVQEGYYTVTANLRDNTYTITPFDASGKTTYASIVIIGSFNGWSDTGTVPMAKTDFNPHYWTLEHTFAEDVEMKFRIASGWESNWGAPQGEEEKLFNKAGGENLKISAGTYMIFFNDLTGNYLFIKK